MNEAAPSAAATLEREETVHAPVDISETARQQFAEWGLSDGRVQELQTMVGAYEYGAADRKVQRAIDNGIYIDLDAKTVSLPGYFDYVGDRTDGQCSEIALRTYRDLLHTGWLNSVNEEREARGQELLDVEFTAGVAGTYFNNPGDTHFWATLKDEAMPPEKTVVLDGSLRTIGVAEEENFQIQQSIAPISLNRYTTSQIELGEFTLGSSGWSEPALNKIPPTMTLGMSESGDAVMNFGFMRKVDGDVIIPVILVINQAGQRATCCVGGNERRTNWALGSPDMSISIEARDEAEKLLSMLSGANPIVASTAEIEAVSTPDQHILF